VTFLLIILVIVICLHDLCTHRIPNTMTTALFLSTSLHPHRESLSITLLTIFLTTFISLLSGIGMGDIKLLAVLIINEGSLVLSRQYLQGLLLAAFATVVISATMRRGLRGSVALAPAILTPFLAIYLAI
jgi:Flp pilus assembly protein protease CpaA